MNPATETAIINRLDSTGLFSRVLSVSEASTQSISAQTTPAAYVGFDGYQVAETNANKKSARLTERWVVYIVTKQAKQSGHKKGRSEALELSASAFKALTGFIPEGSHKPLEPVTPDRPSWDSGFTWVPLAFTHSSVLTAQEP